MITARGKETIYKRNKRRGDNQREDNTRRIVEPKLYGEAYGRDNHRIDNAPYPRIGRCLGV